MAATGLGLGDVNCVTEDCWTCVQRACWWLIDEGVRALCAPAGAVPDGTWTSWFGPGAGDGCPSPSSSTTTTTTTSTTTTTTERPSGHDGGTDAGLVAGAVAGGIALLAVAAVGVVVIRRRLRARVGRYRLMDMVRLRLGPEDLEEEIELDDIVHFDRSGGADDFEVGDDPRLEEEPPILARAEDESAAAKAASYVEVQLVDIIPPPVRRSERLGVRELTNFKKYF